MCLALEGIIMADDEELVEAGDLGDLLRQVHTALVIQVCNSLFEYGEGGFLRCLAGKTGACLNWR